MNRVETVAGVAKELHATEQAIDAAITQATTLVQSLIGARAALSLSPVVAAEAQTKAMNAITALSAARTAIVESHVEMQKDHRRMGWGIFASGPVGKFPEALSDEESRVRLRAV